MAVDSVELRGMEIPSQFRRNTEPADLTTWKNSKLQRLYLIRRTMRFISSRQKLHFVAKTCDRRGEAGYGDAWAAMTRFNAANNLRDSHDDAIGTFDDSGAEPRSSAVIAA